MLGLFSNSADARGPRAGALTEGLASTRSRLSGLFGARVVDASLFEELESALLTSDVGLDATEFLIAGLRDRARHVEGADSLKAELRRMLADMLAPLEQGIEFGGSRPGVIMIVGVNGSGKTTSAGKLCKYFQDQGRSVLLAAGDTFRAAAREQLAAWGERSGVKVATHSGRDPGAVAFDAVVAGRARGIDTVIADTAGRLPSQLHLMEELKKIKRVIAKAQAGAPHEIWLVLDANTGQHALDQVKAFDEALGLTGLVLTKLDGTARGGVLCAIAHAGRSRRAPLPLRFLGVGEGINDLRPFSAREFAAALLD